LLVLVEAGVMPTLNEAVKLVDIVMRMKVIKSNFKLSIIGLSYCITNHLSNKISECFQVQIISPTAVAVQSAQPHRPQPSAPHHPS
jgi:hypothetical protein